MPGIYFFLRFSFGYFDWLATSKPRVSFVAVPDTLEYFAVLSVFAFSGRVRFFAVLDNQSCTRFRIVRSQVQCRSRYNSGKHIKNTPNRLVCAYLLVCFMLVVTSRVSFFIYIYLHCGGSYTDHKCCSFCLTVLIHIAAICKRDCMCCSVRTLIFW